MPDTNAIYEKELLKHIAKTSRSIKRIYEDSINEITVNIGSVRYKNTPFALKDYPTLQKRIEAAIKKMHASVYSVAVNSIKDSWDLSNKKNNILIDARLQGRKPVKKARQILYDPNKRAMISFIDRKENGLKLSDRVWNLLDPFKSELEQSLGFSISKGQSAASTATQIKKYLNEPDKLFRRVRSEEGKLVLSKAAREYHPGRGVYRSSYKNALRLTRTENNMAYRTSDHERWKTIPFVIGVLVKLSNNHPRFDICDHLAGSYPKDFLFRGWHAQCICYGTPIMASDSDFEKMEDAILNGTAMPATIRGSITKPPAGFKKYLTDNEEMLQRLSSTPYFMRDNKKYL